MHMQIYPEGNTPNVGNEKLPNTSTYHRFLYVIQVTSKHRCHIPLMYRFACCLQSRPFVPVLTYLPKSMHITPKMSNTHAPFAKPPFFFSEVLDEDCNTNAVQFLVRNGFYLILDNHTEDPTLTHAPLSTWVQAWANLTTDIISDIPSKNRVMLDLMNEPDHAGLDWSTVRICFETLACELCVVDGMRNGVCALARGQHM